MFFELLSNRRTRQTVYMKFRQVCRAEFRRESFLSHALHVISITLTPDASTQSGIASLPDFCFILLRVRNVWGTAPNPAEGNFPSDSLLRFAAV